MKYVKGPDFPLGGRIVTDRKTIREAYEEGRGSIKVRGEWKLEKDRKAEDSISRIVVYSVPYGVETGPLLDDDRRHHQRPQAAATGRRGRRERREAPPADRAGDEARFRSRSRRWPTSIATRRSSRTSPSTRRASFRTSTGHLVPTRLSLQELLRHFLDFRFRTVTRRFEYQLRQLERRIHISGRIRDRLQRTRSGAQDHPRSQGKQDAAERLRRRFPSTRSRPMPSSSWRSIASRRSKSIAFSQSSKRSRPRRRASAAFLRPNPIAMS